MNLSTNVSKAKTTLIEMGTIATGLAAVGTVIFLYYSNIWKPSVTLVNTDYDLGVAQLIVNGKDVTLYENEKFACGWGWDVEFGTDFQNNMQRVQLVKNSNVYQVLHIR